MLRVWSSALCSQGRRAEESARVWAALPPKVTTAVTHPERTPRSTGRKRALHCWLWGPVVATTPDGPSQEYMLDVTAVNLRTLKGLRSIHCEGPRLHLPSLERPSFSVHPDLHTGPEDGVTSAPDGAWLY
ncbi:hypothetical protein H920_16389 [Fukomys damarensis]|uniref:Uncharacterized protein n=1 Tax=Fukomys damarensis TaxID=885580 RepID=A0A091CWP4_FUKDA|nr:hypothetical protein H920_16389 [Fukomys damarensis]